MEKKGQDPAFPVLEETMSTVGTTYWNTSFGMTKRFFAACVAMQGLVANRPRGSAVAVAVEAFQFADALLVQEEE